MKEHTATITKVEQQKKNKRRYNIFIQDEYAFSVHEDIMVKHRLLKGETIDREQQAAVLHDEERHAAYMKALRIIGRRPHSINELKRKLKQQGYEEPIIDWTIQEMERHNYINDQQFAMQWMDHRIVNQRKGRNFIRQELQQKGLSREHIQEAIEAINPDEEYQGAILIAQKKWNQTTGSGVERKRKTASFLLRRGYTSSIVNKVIQQISQNQQYHEEEFMEIFESESDV